MKTALDRRLKRGFDIGLAVIALTLCSPLLLVAAVGIKLTSSGPILYRAKRAGLHGAPFEMLKFRSMPVGSDRSSAITAPGDQRVFGFGAVLRKLKIDELPQFWNILTGDISVVGPRPEDPAIVARYYTDWMRETLDVRPGITGPGSVYGYIYGDALLDPTDPEGSYARVLLPPKLALERAYLDRASLRGDFGYIALTAWAIGAHLLGRPVALPRADVEAAHRWAPQGPYPAATKARR